MIVLIGHGYVGRYIKKELEKHSLDHVWISHTEHLPVSVDVIINAAGVTGKPNVDACETNRQETVEGNILFPLNLELSNPNTPIVHISSGCVYTGYKDGGYTEEDIINFNFDNASFYSACKGLEQHVLQQFMNKSYLLRIRMPFGPDHDEKNYLTKLYQYEKLIDFENSLSSVEDVAKVAVFFATRKPATGVYNVCNPGSKTTKQISNMLDIHKQWFTEEEFKNAVKAPRSNCVLNVDKLMEVCPIRSVDQAMVETIRDLK